MVGTQKNIPISDPIVLPQDFDINKVTIAAEPNQMGQSKARQAYLNYNGRRLYIQTPLMHCPFGINRWESEDKKAEDKEKFSVDLSFRGKDDNPMMSAFYHNVCEQLDQFLIHKAMEYNGTWLRSSKNNEDAIGAMYSPMIKMSKKDPNAYPPNFKVKMPYAKGEYLCNVYDNKQNVIDLNEMDIRGGKIAVIMQCVGVWLVAGKFGCSWKAVQMHVKMPNVQRGFAFDKKALMDEEDVEEDVEESSAPPPPSTIEEKKEEDGESDDGNKSVDAAATKSGGARAAPGGGGGRGQVVDSDDDLDEP